MRRFDLGILALLLLGGCETAPPANGVAPSYADLPGPPINTSEVTSADHRLGGRTRGFMDIHLSADHPTFIIWNDPQSKKDEWGRITLIEVDDSKAAVIDFGEHRLRAKPGQVFPHTGLYLVNAQPDEQRIWIRSRWVHTAKARP